MPEKEFSGIFPYLVTPIDQSGNLKEDVLRDLVNHLVSKGVHGLTPLGSTGEGAYLPWEVKKKVIEVVVETTAGRVPVIAGVNEITTNGAVKQAIETERIGADGILVVLPTYFPLPDYQVVKHFQSVARAVSCPVVLYTNPTIAHAGHHGKKQRHQTPTDFPDPFFDMRRLPVSRQIRISFKRRRT